MKDILQNIFEASGKPSDLKKYKRTERKETVHFRGSDMYDTKDPGYDDEFSYFDGSGNGYIKDKQGHVYDVIATDRAGDAGAIAGGSHDYYVTIKKANGTDDFHVHGWIAIMSKGSNTGCIADIKAGHYLEDYIAKYWNKWDDKDGKFKELADKGDANAKAYETEKAEKAKNKKDEFNARYIAVPENLSWEIIDGKFQTRYWNLTNKSIEDLKKKREDWLSSNKLRSWDEETKNNPEYKKMQEEIDKNFKELKEIIMSVLEPVCIGRLQEVFKTKDLNSLSGLMGSFGYKKKLSSGKNFGYVMLAIDTKKKVFCIKDEANYKILDGNIELALNDNIQISKGQASEKMIALFKKVSDAWKKTEGRKQTEYVKTHWEAIYDKSAGYWGSHSKTKGQAKEEAKQNFEKMVKDHDFDDPYANKKIFTYSLALVQVYVEGDMEPEAEPVEKPLENPEPKGGESNSDEGGKEEKKERGKNTKMSAGANKAAYDKMKAWHEGTRKQNVANCSDAKLKMNYKVCKELGYEKEMEILKKEAEKREINIEEKLSLQEIVLADNEFDNDTEA